MRHTAKTVFFVLINLPFLIIGFLAAMFVAGYEVGSEAYERWFENSIDEKCDEQKEKP